MDLKLLWIPLVAYLPGALIYRWPSAGRARRAGLAFDERTFWHVMISITWSLAVVLALAAFDAYRLDRLLLVNGVACVAIVVAARSRLGYAGAAPGPRWSTLVPIALIALACWRFFPSAEYLIGGKDPGTYMNEGVQIARTGSLYITEPLVADLPKDARPFFIPDYGERAHDLYHFFSNRFMGFFLIDPDRGLTIGQFPHVYPASIAVAYDTGGIDAAEEVVGFWALLGVLAVFFAGARWLGRPIAAGAAALLTLHILQVWFARSPSSEPAMQAVVFATLLAFSRAHQDDDGFFAPVAAALLGLLFFLRVDAFIIAALIAASAVGMWIVKRQRTRLTFIVPAIVVAVAGTLYAIGPLAPYTGTMRLYLTFLPPVLLVGALAGAVLVVILLERVVRRNADLAARIVPITLSIIVIAAAADALWLRHEFACENPCTGKTAAHDAYALRIFTDFFFTRTGLFVALAGFVVATRRAFWRDPTLAITIAAWALCFFYKIRIVPEHFWMDRRFIPVILPGMLLFTSAGAFEVWTRWGARLSGQLAGAIVAAGILGGLGWHYAVKAQPIVNHIEYEGMTARLENLASRFTDRDLILVESRDAESDVHTLGVPLAFIFGKHVLWLSVPFVDDREAFARFLTFARTRYDHVYFMGSGTDLQSRRVMARAVTSPRFHLRQYEETNFDVYPSHVTSKDFTFGIYELTLGGDRDIDRFAGGLGFEDDLNTLRFYADDYDTNNRQAMRWTKARSYVSIPGLDGRQTTLRLTVSGGRPAQAEAARVEVSVGIGVQGASVPVGVIDVPRGDAAFREYQFVLPSDVMRRAAASDTPLVVTLRSNTWKPSEVVTGSKDNRDLGVMVSRVEVH